MARKTYSSQFKLKIVREYMSGVKQSSLAIKYDINKSTISRIINKFNRTGSTETIHCGGRPRSTTRREDRMIIRKIKHDPFISSSKLQNELNLEISCRTIRRRAVEGGFKSFRAAKKPFISERNRRARLEFAQEKINWTVGKWKTVLFSDESKFNLKGSDGMKTVRRPPNERFNPRFCKTTYKHGLGSIMVWGCFSGQGIGPIHKIDGIMDRFQYKDIMEQVMLPYAEDEMPLRWIFQHDNDPKHTANNVKR